ncbi:MAG TPA: hypothetical protein VFR35_18165 [Actinoplanes sp.]|nr:hypothetical protein [Actinoplanes sp.]
MLFRQDALDRIKAGRVSVVFRRWRYARVRAGSRLRTMIGLIEITSVAQVPRVLKKDVKPAGYPTVEALAADIPGDPGHPLYRIGVAYAGADPRIALRAQDSLSEIEVAGLLSRLDRMDGTSRRGPWTRRVLDLIAAKPAVRAGDLFEEAGYPDMLTFKREVRRLKELGLTESLEVGYRLSPRGVAVRARMPGR